MSVAVATSAVKAAGIEAIGLWHRYGTARALEPLTFALPAPGVVAVTGPNGAGKSTLLRILAGLLRPSGGQSLLTLDGRPIAPAARREHVGYVSPDLQFYEELSVAENLHFAAESRGLERPAAAVEAALARVRLESRARDRSAALSSGLRQRLRIAFALLHRPPVLFLDEPGSHLDDEGRAVLFGIVDEERTTGLVVIATNDQREWTLAERRVEIRGRGLGHSA